MTNIVKGVGHRTLERGTGIFKTKRELFISKGTPRTNKSRFMLVHGSYVDLIIAEEAIHKGINFASCTIIDKLIDEGCREVILGASAIDIAVINTYTDIALLFIHRD